MKNETMTIIYFFLRSIQPNYNKIPTIWKIPIAQKIVKISI